ncbi:hypothetical protein [Pararhizobium polonicum]|uniref:hypothetical protein n=1 Tax=Pararhizobium polonicum TaxID=1612624 RepID=UPI00083A148A|nr:hypothetical protein [Pararhizobium polonicum]
MIISIRLSDSAFDAAGETFELYGLEDELESAVGDFGELDGHETGEGFFRIYFYGVNPDTLVAKMKAILSRGSIPVGSFLELHDDPLGAAIKRVELPLADLD